MALLFHVQEGKWTDPLLAAQEALQRPRKAVGRSEPPPSCGPPEQHLAVWDMPRGDCGTPKADTSDGTITISRSSRKQVNAACLEEESDSKLS